MRFLCLLLGLLLTLFACRSVIIHDVSVARNRGGCKKLRGEVLLFAIFVDSKDTKPFTSYDINITVDSIQLSVDWLNEQARQNDIPLNLKFVYFKGDSFNTINRKLPKKYVYHSVFSGSNPLKKLNRWGDQVCNAAGQQMDLMHKPSIPDVGKPINMERLVARLRDEYQVESVAIMFFVNNYYVDDLSVTINSESNGALEYAIVSFKYPVVITHEFLHLFGASDLYRQLYGQKRANKKLALKLFPKDIMLDTEDKRLNQVEIGEVTRYLVGWQDTLSHKAEPLLLERFKTRGTSTKVKKKKKSKKKTRRR